MTHGKSLQLWHAPGRYVDFAPFHLYINYPPMYDDTRCIDWSNDSRYIHINALTVILINKLFCLDL